MSDASAAEDLADDEATFADESTSMVVTPRAGGGGGGGGVGGGGGAEGEARDYPEEIEGVPVHPNDKSNPPPPHWHDPDRDGVWVHYKVKEEG